MTDHAGNDVFARVPQHFKDVGVRRPRVVVEEFDPPIALAADLSCRLQDDTLQHLLTFHGLDGADQAMTPMRVAQSALAPLLLRGEQPLNRPEFCEWVGLECVYSVEGHVLTPRYMLHTMRRPKALRRADTDPWGPSLPHNGRRDQHINAPPILDNTRDHSLDS